MVQHDASTGAKPAPLIPRFISETEYRFAGRLRVHPNGATLSVPGPGRTANDGGATRGNIVGWSRGSARRNIAFLWAVLVPDLPDEGWSITLTMGGRPETADEWHSARRSVIKSMQRAGATHIHWVTEWTAAGRPHLHMAVYGPREVAARALVSWLSICDKRGWPANDRSQHIVRIHDHLGWLQYVAKHTSRGVDHYQRQGAPDGWTRTGRLWGHTGDWPISEPEEFDLTPSDFVRLRRLLIGYTRAKMRASGAPNSARRRVGQAMRRAMDVQQSTTLGVGYWIPWQITYRFLTTEVLGGGSLGRFDWE